MRWTDLSALATDAAGQLDVLGHDGHALGVDGGQVGVLEQAHQVGLSSLLQGQHCAALEAQVGLEVLGDLTHQALEGQLADQQLRALLVLADLTQSHGSRTVSASQQDWCSHPHNLIVRLLDNLTFSSSAIRILLSLTFHYHGCHRARQTEAVVLNAVLTIEQL